jgi:hypothetical protein
VTTFEPPDSPYEMTFTPGGLLVTGYGDGRVRCHEPSGKLVAELDGAPELAKKKKPAITALAANEAHLAVARKDGGVSVFDRQHTQVAAFAKHETKINGGRSDNLFGLAFSGDGTRLWVSAGIKKAPVGLTGYDLP